MVELIISYLIALFQKAWEFLITNSQIISNFAIVGAFITTIISFAKTFKQNKKDEQIKISIEIYKQLTKTENKLLEVNDKIKYNITNEVTRKDKITRGHNRKVIESYILDHFNNWEWFAFLVNKKFITEKKITEHFRDKFCEEYESLLSKFPNYNFYEVNKLYSKWKK